MSLAEVETAIDELYARKDAWTAVPLPARVELLERCLTSIAAVAERWVELGARIKGLEAGSGLVGEEWLSGPLPTLRNVRLLAEALRQGGAPRPPALWRRADGRTVARVFPATLFDRVLFAGFTADVWIRKGEPPSQGARYRAERRRDGRVCLVLGGGNVSSIPPMDALYKLFVEDEVVALKLNPVNETLGPIFAEALEPLITAGWLRLLYGGADVGAHAAKHDKVGSLHITGSARTYDAIVWGQSTAGARRSGARQNTKPFSAELGCVTPVLVVPGPWSESDIRFQARHLASMVTHNASFNCNAAKVVIVAKPWLQRAAFLRAFHEELARTPARRAYYPGAMARYAAFLERYPGATVVGESSSESVPWTVIPDIGSNDYALREEAFCGIVSELEVDVPGAGGPSAPDFLRRAVAIANESCWGTLSCCIVVHPATLADHPDEVGEAIEQLRYGAIGVNVWPGVIYGLASPTWGAFPGHTPEDIQSGTGVVHNTWLFDHPEKSVVRAPFRIRPTPPWFSDHRNLLDLGRALTSFEAAPSYRGLWRVARAALRG